MIVNFLTDTIQSNLSLLSKIIPTHSQIPVLSSILLEATEETLTMSSTDLEFGVQISVPAKIEEKGGILVPGKQFVETLSLLTHGKIRLAQEKDQIILTTDNSTFKFQVMPKEDFPRLFEEKGEKTSEFTNERFRDIFSKLLFAVSTDEARPHLTGVYMVKKDTGGIDYVATDGYRMSLKRVADDKNADSVAAGLILSPRLISEGLSLKDPNGVSLFVHKGGSQAILETGGATMVGRLIEGTYPDYEKVLPKGLITSIILKRAELLEVLRATSVFARENANVINLDIALGKLTIHVLSNNLGESKATIEGVQTGDDNHIAFNIKFVLDFLKNTTGENITLQVNSPFEPALLTTSDDNEFFHVIMPVRVQE